MCADNTSLNRNHSYIIDVTDRVIVPDSAELIERLHFPENVYTGAQLRFRTIQSFKNSEVHEIKISRQNAYFENEVSRINQIGDFTSKTGKLLSDLSQIDQGEDYSYVRDGIIAELNHLAKVYSGDVQLHIYSDLREHTLDDSELNFYNPAVIDKLHTNPDEVADKYFMNVDLERLSTVQVYFHYESGNWEDVILFEAIAEMWKQYLDTKCVKSCVIASNLNKGGQDE